MNKADVILLSELQRDSSRSVAVLAELAGLSLSACHRRIRVLEAQGLIEGYGARLSPQKLGLGLHVFVEISLVSQSEESMRAFESAVERADEVLECHLMSGSSDYLLRVVATDPGDFDRLHRTCLSRLPGVSSLRSSFSIRRIKEWRGFPVHQKAD